MMMELHDVYEMKKKRAYDFMSMTSKTSGAWTTAGVASISYEVKDTSTWVSCGSFTVTLRKGL